MSLSPMALQVKSYLNAFIEDEKEIDNQIERLSRLTNRMESVGASVISDMPRPSTPSIDKMETMMTQKLSLESAIADAIRVHEKQKEVLNDLLMQINSTERATIRMRYMDGEVWSDIAECIFGGNLDFYERRDSYERRTYRLHDSALENLAKNWSKR